MRLHFLATWWDIITVCKNENRLPSGTIAEVESFLNDPVSWSAGHGGKSELPR